MSSLVGTYGYFSIQYITKSSLLDIKSLTEESNPDIMSELGPAFKKYNEEQLVTVKLPGSSQSVRTIVLNDLTTI